MFKARTPGLLTLACLLVAAPATAQVNYAVSGSTAYVTDSWRATGAIVIASTYLGYPVTYIGPNAFSGTSLTSVTIPNSVTNIGYQAFWHSGLTSVTIPNSVTGIFDEAFSGCANLTNVTIPDSVTSIGAYVFRNCTSLTNLSVDAANPAYSSLNGVLFDKAQTTLVTYPANHGGSSYVIPGSVTRIGAEAFYPCTNLTSVTIPNRVTDIGYRSFFFCTSLTNVIIGNSVTNIWPSAFVYCTSLTSLTIPASVTQIGVEAFARCTNLTNVTFLGNKPALGYFVEFCGWFCGVGAGARAYYYCGTTGWGPTYGELPTVMLFAPRIAPGSAGVKAGGFGFILTCLTNQTIVVEASANLANWQPIWTNTLSGASADFVDPQWLHHQIRFYRARSD